MYVIPEEIMFVINPLKKLPCGVFFNWAPVDVIGPSYWSRASICFANNSLSLITNSVVSFGRNSENNIIIKNSDFT